MSRSHVPSPQAESRTWIGEALGRGARMSWDDIADLWRVCWVRRRAYSVSCVREMFLMNSVKEGSGWAGLVGEVILL